MGDHLFLNYIFLGQLLLINRGGIINPHLALYIYMYIYIYVYIYILYIYLIMYVFNSPHVDKHQQGQGNLPMTQRSSCSDGRQKAEAVALEPQDPQVLAVSGVPPVAVIAKWMG